MASRRLLSITLAPALCGLFIRGKIRRRARATRSTARSIRGLRAGRRASSLAVPLADRRWSAPSLLDRVDRIPLVRASAASSCRRSTRGRSSTCRRRCPACPIARGRARCCSSRTAILKTFPEVESVFGKVGRAETATDPAPLDMVETTVTLEAADRMAAGHDLGRVSSPRWTSGADTPACRTSGGCRSRPAPRCSRPACAARSASRCSATTSASIERSGRRSSRPLPTVPGTRSAFAERATGGYYLDFDVKRDGGRAPRPQRRRRAGRDRDRDRRHDDHADRRGARALRRARAVPPGAARHAGTTCVGTRTDEPRHRSRCGQPCQGRSDERWCDGWIGVRCGRGAGAAGPARDDQAGGRADGRAHRGRDAHGVGLRGRRGPRHRQLRGRGTADGELNGHAATRLLPRVERPVRVHAARPGAHEARRSRRRSRSSFSSSISTSGASERR